METFFLFLIVLGIVGQLFCQQDVQLNSNEREAEEFLIKTSEKLFNFFDKIGNKSFNGSPTDYYYTTDDIYYRSEFLKGVVDDAKKFDFKNFKDEELKYAFDKLTKVAENQIIGPDRYVNLKSNIKGVSDELIPEYSNGSMDLSYYDIKNIFLTSKDPQEVQYYWSAWRNKMAGWGFLFLLPTLKAIKDAANLTEMSPLEFWLKGNNITEMENLMNDIQPLYLELHAFLRNLLRKKYGDSIVGSDGLIPEHLFEQIRDQAMTNNSLIEEMFPYDKLPPVNSVIMEEFSAKDLYREVDQFYKGLGFTRNDKSFWSNRIKLRDDDECFPRVFYLTPNVHLEYCKNMNYVDFLDAYSKMGYIYYAREMEGLPAYYFKAPQGLEIAIGKAIQLSSSTFHNLEKIGMIPDINNITDEVEMNRLLRTAIVHLLNIPVKFVHAKLMADLLLENIGIYDLNTSYWKLMNQYVGVRPPIDHITLKFDLPSEFYEGIVENYMSRDFITEILSYQLYKELCALSENYPKQRLHLCDIGGNTAVGSALKIMMRFGISKPFTEILEIIFPDHPSVRSFGLLEYYFPVKELITKINKETNVKTGWESYD